MKQKLLFSVTRILLSLPIVYLLVGCSNPTAVDSLHFEYAIKSGGCTIVADPIGAVLSDKVDKAMVPLVRYRYDSIRCAALSSFDAGNDTLPVAFAKGSGIAEDFAKYLLDSVAVNYPELKVAVPDSSYLLYGNFCELIRRFCGNAEFVVIRSDMIGDMLLSGHVSMALASWDERIEYSLPFYADEMVLVEKPKEEKGKIIHGVEDLDGMSIIVETGSVQEIYASKQFKNSKVVMVDALPDLFLQLDQGKADALLVAETIWRMMAKDYPGICSVCDTIYPQPVAVAFSKDEPQLREAFNAFQKGLEETGELKRMHDEWYDPNSGREMPHIDGMEFPNGVLDIAFYSCVPPFNYIKDGKPCGSEVELVTRFAIHMGMEPRFADMSFTSLIPYVQSGKAKMAISTICSTEERAKQIDFADPWLMEHSSLLVGPNHAPDGMLKANSGNGRGFLEGLEESFKNNIITESRWKLFVEGLRATVLISLFSAIFGTLLGILLCFMAMSKMKLVAEISSLFIEFMRRMPQVVLLMILFYVVFADVDMTGGMVAIVGFTLCFGAYTSVIFRSAVESIDKGQTEAGLSMGFDRFKTFYYFILPQVIMRALPVYKGEFIGLVKATSIVGYIAVLDLTKAGDIVRSRTFEAFFPLILITIMYFLVIWILSLVIKYFQFKSQPRRSKFSPKRRKK